MILTEPKMSIVRVLLGWQWQGERAAAGVPWRFGVAALQRPHVGVAGALATGREGAGGCGRAVAFSGVLYHNIIQLCVCPSWIRLPAEFLHVDNSTCRVYTLERFKVCLSVCLSVWSGPVCTY